MILQLHMMQMALLFGGLWLQPSHANFATQAKQSDGEEVREVREGAAAEIVSMRGLTVRADSLYQSHGWM